MVQCSCHTRKLTVSQVRVVGTKPSCPLQTLERDGVRMIQSGRTPALGDPSIALKELDHVECEPQERPLWGASGRRVHRWWLPALSSSLTVWQRPPLSTQQVFGICHRRRAHCHPSTEVILEHDNCLEYRSTIFTVFLEQDVSPVKKHNITDRKDFVTR